MPTCCHAALRSHGGLLHLRRATLLELHVSALGATRAATRELETRKTSLDSVLDSEGGSSSPQDELEGAEDGDSARGAADSTAAEEKLGQEDAESDKAGEVEEHIRHFERQYSRRVVD